MIGPGQTHCGMCFRNFDGVLKFVHLAMHHDLRHGDIPPHYQIGLVKRHPSILKHLAIICSLIVTADPMVPYGFDPSGVSFDPATGAIRIEGDGKGLTCASFIISVLRSQGLQLLKEAEWSEYDNFDWQMAMLNALKERASPEYFALASGQVGMMRRFTPQEVVGAAQQSTWPVPRSRAQNASDKVMRELRPYSSSTAN